MEVNTSASAGDATTSGIVSATMVPPSPVVSPPPEATADESSAEQPVEEESVLQRARRLLAAGEATIDSALGIGSAPAAAAAEAPTADAPASDAPAADDESKDGAGWLQWGKGALSSFKASVQEKGLKEFVKDTAGVLKSKVDEADLRSKASGLGKRLGEFLAGGDDDDGPAAEVVYGSWARPGARGKKWFLAGVR